MNNLSNKLDNNFGTEKNITQNNLENTEIKNTEINSTSEKDSNNYLNENSDSLINEEKSESLEVSDELNQELTNENDEVSNCLALTVQKDYNLSVVKNVFVRTVKGIWKVAISIFTLNIIKFFL